MAEEFKFEYWAEKNENSTFWNLRIVKTMMRGTQFDDYPIEKVSKIDSVVLVKYESEFIEKKIFLSFMEFFGEPGLWDKGEYQIFLVEGLSTNPEFSIWILTEKIELVVDSKKFWFSSETILNGSF